MKLRYRKFLRGSFWWAHDGQTGKQTSLKIKSKSDALRLLDVMNQPYQNADYPERFAQEALGHNRKAVHRAYARNAKVELPALSKHEIRSKMN